MSHSLTGTLNPVLARVSTASGNARAGVRAMSSLPAGVAEEKSGVSLRSNFSLPPYSMSPAYLGEVKRRSSDGAKAATEAGDGRERARAVHELGDLLEAKPLESLP
jgi:hypothetical protein